MSFEGKSQQEPRNWQMDRILIILKKGKPPNGFICPCTGVKYHNIQTCLLVYAADSGERLQDHWSSGFFCFTGLDVFGLPPLPTGFLLFASCAFMALTCVTSVTAFPLTMVLRYFLFFSLPLFISQSFLFICKERLLLLHTYYLYWFHITGIFRTICHDHIIGYFRWCHHLGDISLWCWTTSAGFKLERCTVFGIYG